MFEASEEVKQMAESIINEHHPHLVDSKDLIGYYIRDNQGIDWAGKAKKCTAFERYTTGKMMFVFINEEAWRTFHHEKRKALVDHELCHFRRASEKVYSPSLEKFVEEWAPADDPDSWAIRDHDVEEFSEIIKRHGLWDEGVENFARAVRKASYQMDIFDEEEKPLRVAK